MQIFRPYQSHEQSAKFLDNRRLSKQVLELYQIMRVCLAEMQIIEGNTRYLSHPVVKHVFNEGHPYLIDTLEMLLIMDQEHRRRGGSRSEAFKEDLAQLRRLIELNAEQFCNDDIPPFYVYGEAKLTGEAVYDAYRQLLYDKWMLDKIAPRCSVKYLYY